MNEIATATSNILNAIEPALVKLSETFCVSVDFLKENAMQYIMMYGRYELSKSIMFDMGIAIFVGCIIGLFYVMCNYDEHNDKWKISIRKRILGVLIPILVIFIITALMTTIPYIVSPEIYSIKQIMYLIR